ncbi:hypothetical protein RHGRI_030712 [Rhododendron griersonianum]|uniref:Uncharacterized protein n=1 Tax=Rhododendron griersonianum TaxID=479676 RepID=A0AAV6I7K3_9ERIC|nr:hypothetical protein RHGRI_030712 [Rhododendron griersonianum]
MEITAAMVDDERDQNLTSPNSLASYQSGLLEAMLVEQEGGERSSSPMETSAIASKEEVKGEEEQEQSCREKIIQFGSIPEVQINMVHPSDMKFVSPDWSPTPLVSQPNDGPLEIIEISSSEELEAWEETQESKEAQMVDGDYDILILTNEIQDIEATSKESASFAPDANSDSDLPLIHAKTLTKQFCLLTFTYIPRFLNEEAYEVAQRASG